MLHSGHFRKIKKARDDKQIVESYKRVYTQQRNRHVHEPINAMIIMKERKIRNYF
jgi:hypothetical protein